jgi:hypothetical protein
MNATYCPAPALGIFSAAAMACASLHTCCNETFQTNWYTSLHRTIPHSSHRDFRSGEDELFGKAETDFIVEDMSKQDFEAC